MLRLRHGIGDFSMLESQNRAMADSGASENSKTRGSYAQKGIKSPLAALTASQSNDLAILLQLRDQLVTLPHHVVVPADR
jgi:hypothetical protein